MRSSWNFWEDKLKSQETTFQSWGNWSKTKLQLWEYPPLLSQFPIDSLSNIASPLANILQKKNLQRDTSLNTKYFEVMQTLRHKSGASQIVTTYVICEPYYIALTTRQRHHHSQHFEDRNIHKTVHRANKPLEFNQQQAE